MPLDDRVNIDEQMALVIKRMGGEVLDEVLPANRDFQNADYLFREYGVIAELKRLDDDNASSPGFRAKLSAVYSKLMAEGHVPRVFGTQRVTISGPIAGRAFLEVYQERLATIVKKANRQIKETAARLGIENPKGLLLLANDGDMAFEFEIVLCALGRLIRADQFRSINQVIYFTPNHTCSIAGIHPASRLWVPLPAPARVELGEDFNKRLFDGWANRIASLKGEPVTAMTIDGQNGTHPAQVKLNDAPTIMLKPMEQGIRS